VFHSIQKYAVCASVTSELNADGAPKYVLALTKQSAVVHYSSVRTVKTATDAMLPFGSLSVFISFDIDGN
jgi:hypothetical protein